MIPYIYVDTATFGVVSNSTIWQEPTASQTEGLRTQFAAYLERGEVVP